MHYKRIALLYKDFIKHKNLAICIRYRWRQTEKLFDLMEHEFTLLKASQM